MGCLVQLGELIVLSIVITYCLVVKFFYPARRFSIARRGTKPALQLICGAGTSKEFQKILRGRRS